MANYKVPQDVEAEDKLLGPLTLKQFIFAMAFVGILYLTYVIFLANPFLSLMTLPFLIITGAFAFWQRKDQPIEVFFRAGILFLTKPHIRRWDQDGALKLVEILVPKKVVKRYTDGRSSQEVRSQLTQLSSVLDTRGWNNRLGSADTVATERLVPLAETPVTHHVADLKAFEEPDDQQNDSSSIAQNVQHQIDQTGLTRQEQIQQMMKTQIQQLNENVPTPQQFSPQHAPLQAPEISNFHQPQPAAASETKTTATQAQVVQPQAQQITQRPAQPIQTSPDNSDKIAQAELSEAPQNSAQQNVLQEGEELDLH